MSITINVNGLTLVHQGSGGSSHNTLPDICLTPPHAEPIEYENESYSADLANGTTTVFADGGNSIANLGAIFATSVLDEPGAMGGIISHTFMAESDFITHSHNVFIEGQPACRLTDKMWMNHRNTVNMAGEKQENLKNESMAKLCAAICMCRKGMRAAVAAGTDIVEMDFWKASIVKSGGVPTSADISFRTQEECVASQFSSGWPLYTPHEGSENYLAEATYDMTKNPFKLLTSLSNPPRHLSNGQLAPMSPMKAIGQVGPGKAYAMGNTFRPDFVMLRKPGTLAEGDNIRAYVEIKFKGDELTDNQTDAQRRLKQRGEGETFVVINEEDCCGDDTSSKRELNKIIKEIGESMNKAIFLFFPGPLGGRFPGFGGLPSY